MEAEICNQEIPKIFCLSPQNETDSPGIIVLQFNLQSCEPMRFHHFRHLVCDAFTKYRRKQCKAWPHRNYAFHNLSVTFPVSHSKSAARFCPHFGILPGQMLTPSKPSPEERENTQRGGCVCKHIPAALQTPKECSFMQACFQRGWRKEIALRTNIYSCC